MAKSIQSGHVFHNRIAYFRSVLGFKQSDLASRLGVSVNTVSSWETGVSIPTAYYAKLLCEVFEVPFHVLFSLEFN